MYVNCTFVLETSNTTGGHKMQCKLKREVVMNLKACAHATTLQASHQHSPWLTLPGEHI